MGAGIAGLTVAHELALTGWFDIEVIEQGHAAGGKARTTWDPQRFREHSMRILVGSYVCIHQILAEVVTEEGPLIERLRPAILSLRWGPYRHEFTGYPQAWFWRLRYVVDQVRLLRFLRSAGLGMRDLVVFIFKLLRFLTIKAWQVTSEISRLSFEDYVSDERRSEGFERIVFPIAEILVAAKPYASAGVVGRSLLEWFVNPFLVGPHTRRGFSELDGPTSEAFIEPWVQWLTAQGVRFRYETLATAVDIDVGQVIGVTVQHAKEIENVRADVYVLAVQHNIAHALLPDDAVRYIPELANFIRLGEEWAHSVQCVVGADDPEVLELGRKLVGVLDSPWSIAFRIYSAKTMRPGTWAKGPLPLERAILTATISNCRRPGIVHGLPFLRCTMEQIIDELSAQTGLQCLTRQGATLGLDLELVDRDAIDDNDPEHLGHTVASIGQHNLAFRTSAQMYVRLPGNLDIEPENATGLYNFFLAGEYTRTRYMIPTMEKSCESGKRCAHAVLTALGMPKSPDRVPHFELPLAFVRTEFFWLMAYVFATVVVALAGLAWLWP